MTSRLVMGVTVFAIAMVILLFAAAVQAYEEKAEEEAKLRRWEKKVNAKYREEFIERYGNLEIRR